MQSKIRVLWVSDSPEFATGFGRVTRELLKRLIQHPHLEIACLAWGYSGWPINLDFPIRCYPATHTDYGKEIFERVVNDFNPDIVISLGEIWMLQWMHENPTRSKFKWIAYLPIDGGPVYEPWVPLLQGMDEVVAMSEFGKEVLCRGLPSKHIHLIPHGVDCGVFKPLESRDALKSHERFQNKFMIGCIARNQPRKNIPAIVKAFNLLKDKYEDMHLYLHMNPSDVGYDIVTLLRRYKLNGRADVASPEQSLESLDRSLSDKSLNHIYNLCDITVLASNAEGFGLPILESLAAGVPVVATDFSACTELVLGHGELAKVATTVTVGVNLIEHGVVDVNHLALCIEKLYLDSNLRVQYGRSGRQFAMQFEWDLLIRPWIQLINKTAGVSWKV